VYSTSVLDGLDADWRRLVHSPAARDGLARWTRRQPLLDGITDLSELLELRHGQGGPVVLQTLAEVAGFDDLAARVLLQALLPGIVRIAGSVGDGDPDAVVELLGYTWERIRTYPPDRAGSVAANILLDVRKRYHREHHRSEPPSPPERTHQQSVEETAISRVLFGQVFQACRDGVITDQALLLILRSRVADEDVAAIAAERAETVHAVTTRRCRAERRLRAHLEHAA
jgi:hypothetical protein